MSICKIINNICMQYKPINTYILSCTSEIVGGLKVAWTGFITEQCIAGIYIYGIGPVTDRIPP